MFREEAADTVPFGFLAEANPAEVLNISGHTRVCIKLDPTSLE